MAIVLTRVCVFCGSSPGRDPAYTDVARRLGATLAERGIDLVYGGGAVGLMGEVADAVLAAGGRVTGVIPRFLDRREIAHAGVTDLRVVESMHERKALMAELSDGFVALPGGVGTFEELFEAITWTQLRVHDKPVALLDVRDYWAPVRALLDLGVAERFVTPQLRAALIEGTDPHAVLDAMTAWERPAGEKWMDAEQRSRDVI